jgi:hypothetical protein
MRKLLQAVTMLTALACGAAPAAMLYVDPANPDAADAGAGDALHPYRTLVHAMTQLAAAAADPGDTGGDTGGSTRPGKGLGRNRNK